MLPRFSTLCTVVAPAVLYLFGSSARVVAATAPQVDKIEIHDTIQPISAGRLDRAIEKAGKDGSSALLVELDTPGGLLDSTRQMVGDILRSRVPVIVYVTPAGTRAASAGFFILESADVAAMAPGTNAGAAHPVLESGTPDDTMRQKIENDAAAFLRSYTSRRGRNAEVAETAVRTSKSFSADEALNQHLIDRVAGSETQLLDSIDGMTIHRDTDNGQTDVTLHLRGAHVVTIEPTLREQLLSYLANPNIALILLVGGGLLIYLEFNIPGTIVPGALGTVMVLVAIFALNLLPIRHTALLLLIAAAVLMVLEVKFASHGMLAIAGIVCLAFGTLTLVDAPIPEMRVQPTIAISLCLAFGIITVVLLRLAVKARRMKALTGPAALVGSEGSAMEPIWLPGTEPIGRIQVQGEIWQATSSEPIPERAPVRVTGFHGDILEVQPGSAVSSSPKSWPS
ncbi:nodulation protein NfeD [Acidicapsa dinghuensis]|uniref:Nodulation protein NfeD n=1 Tax=Acidicapsa dinghuensis TaxID=2218256 RepID=A0ABW1EDX9_9BACT|nr:nodulation protein NfeD [Acidicapsa dinghuensis]